MDISRIDKNFANTFTYEGMKLYNVNEAPFKLYGLCREEGELDFKRMPHSFPETVDNPVIKAVYKKTAGLRVRFKTDSKRIILKCELPEKANVPHMATTGSSCFDLYVDGHYFNVFRPGIDANGRYSDDKSMDGGFASGYTLKGEKKMREILIHFPLYNEVTNVYIGLEEDAQIQETAGYPDDKPVVFYGSSITQGACASHPGNSYIAMLARHFDFNYVNLGFSGGCRAELELARYIADLDLKAFVLDYDHNAPSLADLEATHEPFFKEFRRLRPDVPVIMVSASDFCSGLEGRLKRRDVIRKTYENAVANGDKNVYFVDGSVAYDLPGVEMCTVDNVHPNDLGFWCIYRNMIPAFEKLFK